MRRIVSLLLLVLIRSVAAGAVYVCGAFNGWDPKNPLELQPNSEGVYTGVIDFTKGTSYKMSTVKGFTGNGWTEFDSGVLSLDDGTEATVNTWLPITASNNTSNQNAPVAEILTLKVDMDAMLLMYDDGGSPATPWSGTLPVMFVTTEGRQPVTSKETYLNATYYLDPMGIEGVDAIGSADAQLDVQIRGRGNYTWTGFDKKPYRIKFGKKTAILGMDKSKHFALLAHADDDLGFMRNTMGFALSEIVGMPWTPRQAPVEVVLNGDYIGLYFLTETIRVDTDRVDVVEQADGATEDVDGGWLVEIDNYDSDPHITVNENGGAPIWFTYKSPEILSSEQSDYLYNQMLAIDKAVYQSDKSDIGSLARLVDIDILARYYIVQQVMCDEESFHGSCYLNRQRGAAQKWKFGPVWDFGNAFRSGRGDSPRFIFQRPEFNQVWIGEIYKYPEFQAVVKNVWGELLGGGLFERMTDIIDEFRDQIAVAAIYNARRWSQYGNDDIYSAAAKAKKYLDNSITWLRGEWGSPASVEAVTGNEAQSEYFDLYGREIAEPTKGICIRRQGNTVTKIVM